MVAEMRKAWSGCAEDGHRERFRPRAGNTPHCAGRWPIRVWIGDRRSRIGTAWRVRVRAHRLNVVGALSYPAYVSTTTGWLMIWVHDMTEAMNSLCARRTGRRGARWRAAAAVAAAADLS